ncbi:MAG: hypothetical protein OXE85_09260 [Roseovarius sp.]|nr:hypothetical protein [Roseovarius sp.]
MRIFDGRGKVLNCDIDFCALYEIDSCRDVRVDIWREMEDCKYHSRRNLTDGNLTD